MKKKGLVLGIILVLSAGVLFTYKEMKGRGNIQRSIADNVIRFHIIANSDMEKDQDLKLAVKDEIVKNLRYELSDTKNLESARKILKENLGAMEEIAVREMEKRGYQYEASAELDFSYFPVKKYGDMTFPEGEYEAVKVSLGEAKGRNWWCVMYPTLCFIDSTYQVVPEESKEILKKDLTAEEYKILLEGENISYGFKLLEWVENLFQ